jgi:hypothetical protein
MAGNPSSSKWDLTNWTPGTVSLFEALGIKKGTIQYPNLQAELTSADLASAPQTSTAGGGGSTSGGNTVAPSGTSEQDWIEALLTSLNAPITQNNVNSIAAWISKETSWNAEAPDGALYTNNPLNTTQAESGATSINSAGVKKYATAKIGIMATVATLLQYPAIVAALKTGNGLCGSNLSASFSKWSGGGYSSVC